MARVKTIMNLHKALAQALHAKISLIVLFLNTAFSHTHALFSSFCAALVLPLVKLAHKTTLYSPPDYVAQIKANRDRHEVVTALQNMINMDGAGTWPPKASHRDTWPEALRPYHDIFVELAPLLPVDQVSVNDTVNQSRRGEYRSRMQKLLDERIDLSSVKAVLSAAEAESESSASDSKIIPRDARNGLFACIGHLRHAFRWATIPIVKPAQEEKFIDFPPHLDIPWSFLCKRYGIESQSANLMSNMYCNFNNDDPSRLVYRVNSGMPEPVPTAEFSLAYAFTETEKQAVPIYHHLTKAITTFTSNRKHQTATHLSALNAHLSSTLKVYYDWVVESRIPRSVFVAYNQGFHGWAAGETTPEGEYTEYDGVSGAQLVLFNVLDGFLGLETFLSRESLGRCLSSWQREFLAAVRRASIRGVAESDEGGRDESGNGNGNGNREVVRELEGIVKRLRAFRSAHKKRTSSYLSVERQERAVMTAGASTLESGDQAKAQDLVHHVDAGLAKKMKDTV